MNTFGNMQNQTFEIRESGNRELTRSKYNLLISGTVAWGFVVNLLICMLCGDSLHSVGLLIPGGLYVAVNIITIIVIAATENAAVGFGCFTVLAASMGFLLSSVVAEFSGTSIVWAMIQTGAVCAGIGLLSTIFPNYFLSLGRGLFATLLIVVAAEVVVVLVTGTIPGIATIALTLTYAGYLGYDLVKAQILEPTIGNAIFCAVDIYLDIFNIFLNLLLHGKD